METLVSHPIIESFLKNFSIDKRIIAIQYILVIGIEYIGNFTSNTKDLFQTLKKIASFCFFLMTVIKFRTKEKIESKSTIFDQQPFKTDIQNIKEELKRLNEKFEEKIKLGKTFENQDPPHESSSKNRCESMPSMKNEESNTLPEKKSISRKSMSHDDDQRSNSVDARSKHDSISRKNKKNTTKKPREVTKKITQTVPPNLDDVGPTKIKLTRHHLDDSEIKNLLQPKNKMIFTVDNEKEPEKKKKKPVLPPKSHPSKEQTAKPMITETMKMSENKENNIGFANNSNTQANINNTAEFKANKVNNKPSGGLIKKNNNSLSSQNNSFQEKKKVEKVAQTEKLNQNRERMRKFQKNVFNEQKIDYSHVRSKIKDEIEYDKQLKRQGKKFSQDSVQIFESKKIPSESLRNYDENLEKKKNNDFNNASEEEINESNRNSKNPPRTSNYYSESNKRNSLEEKYKYKPSWGKEEGFDPEYSYSMENQSINKLTQQALKEGSEGSFKHNISYGEEEDQSNSKKDPYEDNNFNFNPKSSKNSKNSDYYAKPHYGDFKRKSKEEYYRNENPEESQSSQQNYSYFKPINEMSRFSNYSSLKNQKTMGDIANDFLNSPLMGKISEEGRKESGKPEIISKNVKYRTTNPEFDKYYYIGKENNQENFSNLRKMHSLSTNPNPTNNLQLHSSGMIYNNKRQSQDKEHDNHSSSMSSNFSVFNPNEELKSFFQKEFLHNNQNKSNSKNESSFGGEERESMEYKNSECHNLSNVSSKKELIVGKSEEYERKDKKERLLEKNSSKQVYDYSSLFKKKI